MLIAELRGHQAASPRQEHPVAAPDSSPRLVHEGQGQQAWPLSLPLHKVSQILATGQKEVHIFPRVSPCAGL